MFGRFSADDAYAITNMKLGKNGSKIEVNERLSIMDILSVFQIVEMDLLINLEDMHLEMECLFPK